MSRLPLRVRSVVGALLHSMRPRRKPQVVKRILIAHDLLLGDTLMLTPLLAKLRARYPDADIVMMVRKAFLPIYAARPYGIRPIAFDPREMAGYGALKRLAPYDIAWVPGDNRYGWLARSLGAQWVVAFSADRPRSKNWPIDELRAYPDVPMAWGDMVATLVDGPAAPPYRLNDWSQPAFDPFQKPAKPYCVLHVGASSALKRWPAAEWRALAQRLEARGFGVVWSGGRGEEHLVQAIDPEQHYVTYAGKLDLAQLWALLADAALLVCPDTGVAHLGRHTGTPTVTLFGPGSAVICGAGAFWRDSPYRAVTIPDFPCRDQRILFRREIAWVRRCGRGLDECDTPRCMQAITLRDTLDAVAMLVGPE